MDGRGIPLALAIAGANRNDFKLTFETLQSHPVPRPKPGEVKQNECLDKGYDYAEVFALLERFGYTPHVRARGEEAKRLAKGSLKKARRWVVERLHSWLNRFRRLLVRWEKKARNYLAMLHFALGIICLRAAGVLSG